MPNTERNEHEFSRNEDPFEEVKRDENIERQAKNQEFNIEVEQISVQTAKMFSGLDSQRESQEAKNFVENSSQLNQQEFERTCGFQETSEGFINIRSDLNFHMEYISRANDKEIKAYLQETGENWFVRLLRWLFSWTGLFASNPQTTNHLLAGEKTSDKDFTPLLFTYYNRLALGEPIDDLKDYLPQDLQSANELYTKWCERSETEFWTSMAAYPEADPDATLNDHLYFCQYIKILADSSDLFMWEKGDDQLAIINQLVDAYQQSQNNSIASLYRGIATYQYQGQPLPRNVAAEVLELAIVKLLMDLPS